MKIIKIKKYHKLASEISEMVACEVGHSTDETIKKLAVDFVGNIYVINHWLTSDCCVHRKKIWEDYKEEYKGWFGKKKYNYYNNIFKYENKINTKA